MGADGDLGEVGAYEGSESIAIHAEISRCIAQAQKARLRSECGYFMGHSVLRVGGPLSRLLKIPPI
ncbi:hypothetical protein BJI67_07430 [Acidihalobacter aeolianus]|uniref:Uncharacterized protein n=1 Tax=Acidihalobacter aeolianus TaxID=2792603 RepID=A0A1D8K7J9_9GAMM|nr:hypothetical protein BJI67_07430 [Acidihalobacter aeolianus]